MPQEVLNYDVLVGTSSFSASKMPPNSIEMPSELSFSEKSDSKVLVSWGCSPYERTSNHARKDVSFFEIKNEALTFYGFVAV